MTLFDKALTILFSVLSTLPSLLTLSFFNLWLKDQGCPKSLLASFAIIGLPHYFKSILALVMHHLPKKGPADQEYWARWMTGSLLVCSITAWFLGLSLEKVMYRPLIFWGLFLNTAAVFFQKALYFYQICDESPEDRDEQTTLSRISYRWGHHFGEFCTLLAVSYLGWMKIYQVYSAIFFIFGIWLWRLSKKKIFHKKAAHLDRQSRQSHHFSPRLYGQLIWEHRYFLLAIFSVVSSDTLIGWHLHLYLRHLGLSYTSLAIVSKGWGLIIYTLGASLAYKISAQRHTLCLYTMIATLLHGFSFIPLAFASSNFYTLLMIFFMKNITLGLKSILFLRFTTHYIGQYQERVEIYLLSSATRSLLMFIVSLSAGWVGASKERLFGLAFVLSLSAFGIMNEMRSYWAESKS